VADPTPTPDRLSDEQIKALIHLAKDDGGYWRSYRHAYIAICREVLQQRRAQDAQPDARWAYIEGYATGAAHFGGPETETPAVLRASIEYDIWRKEQPSAPEPTTQAGSEPCRLRNLMDDGGGVAHCVTHDTMPEWVECTGWRCVVSGQIITEQAPPQPPSAETPAPQDAQPQPASARPDVERPTSVVGPCDDSGGEFRIGAWFRTEAGARAAIAFLLARVPAPAPSVDLEQIARDASQQIATTAGRNGVWCDLPESNVRRTEIILAALQRARETGVSNA